LRKKRRKEEKKKRRKEEKKKRGKEEKIDRFGSLGKNLKIIIVDSRTISQVIEFAAK
jgi:hypothetical protein